MAERFKAPVLKTDEGVSSPRVRIPPPPPTNRPAPAGRFAFWGRDSKSRMPANTHGTFSSRASLIGFRQVIEAMMKALKLEVRDIARDIS